MQPNHHAQVVSIRFRPGILRALDQFCRRHGVTRSQACRLALLSELRQAGVWPLVDDPNTRGER